MTSPTVDKATLLAGATCRTQGWYTHHAPTEAPSPGLAWRFHAGTDVARRARQWLGAGTMLPRAPLAAALEATAAALRNPATPLLFEASFLAAPLAARADALQRNGDGWRVLEIKAGTSPAAEKPVAQAYIDDIAYTLMVARAAGLAVNGAALVLINRDYRLGEAAPPFVIVDVTDAARARADALAVAAPEIAAMALGETRPPPELRFACRHCDFFAAGCVGTGIPDPLFLLPRLSAKRFDALRHYERISRLPATADLTDHQRVIAEVIRAGAPRRNGAGLALLDQVRWPVAYLDFETINPHLPWFEGCPPYDAVPFQYSLHLRDAAAREPTHRHYLADAEGDWRRELVTRLLDELGTSGSIMVYSSYEHVQLRRLAQLFPDLAERIASATERLFDLEKVIREGYVHPDFGGRTSIKKVLPVLVPALGYDDLPIGNGDDAAGVFGLMRVGAIDPEEHPDRRRALLEYCHLDTLAMVRLHEALGRLRADGPG